MSSLSRVINNASDWVTERTPGLMPFYRKHLSEYYAPKNFNLWYYFGSLAMLVLVNQLVTGIWLTMFYKPSAAEAFASVEFIMRDVEWGWLIRYMHSTGASAFFVVVYLHMFRAMIYGSYQKPREIVWILGMLIFLALMAEAFMGYVLPWGQMSYWGATVITNLFSAIPVVGESIRTLLWGGFSVDNPTLNRFFSLHYLLPFAIFGVVALHIWAFHTSGNNNPSGVEIKDVKKDAVPFHPYYTVKDGFAIVVFLILFAMFVFFNPNGMGHPDNYIEANPLSTPASIVPEWYFLPFYAILRAITFDLGPISSKLGGVIAMFSSILILFVLPWLDTSKVRSMRYRPVARMWFFLFVIACIALGWLGGKPAEGSYVLYAQIATAYYFGFFLIILPLLGILETPKPLPRSISESVLQKSAKQETSAAPGAPVAAE